MSITVKPTFLYMCKYITLTEYNSHCSELIRDPHPTLTDLRYPLLKLPEQKAAF